MAVDLHNSARGIVYNAHFKNGKLYVIFHTIVTRLTLSKLLEKMDNAEPVIIESRGRNISLNIDDIDTYWVGDSIEGNPYEGVYVYTSGLCSYFRSIFFTVLFDLKTDNRTVDILN